MPQVPFMTQVTFSNRLFPEFVGVFLKSFRGVHPIDELQLRRVCDRLDFAEKHAFLEPDVRFEQIGELT